MKTLQATQKRNKIVKIKKTHKNFNELSYIEKERTAYILVEKHFKKYNSIQKTTELWNCIFDLLKNQIFYLRGKNWIPNNLTEILNF